jgi:hypothetical protein
MIPVLQSHVLLIYELAGGKEAGTKQKNKMMNRRGKNLLLLLLLLLPLTPPPFKF